MSGTTVPLPAWAHGVLDVPTTWPAVALGVRASGPHVIEVALPHSGRSVVMKHYPDGTGGRTMTVMTTLSEALRGMSAAPLQVPAVLGWRADSGVLVQAPAPGVPLLTVLRSVRRAVALKAAARGLACLHGLPVRTGHQARIPEHLSELVRPGPADLTLRDEEAAPRVRALTAAVRAWDAGRLQPSPVPLHRDAHPRQMLLEDTTLWVLDWDLAAEGDAALDVANFAVYLQTRPGLGGAPAAAAFIDEYLKAGTDVTSRLPWFIATTYIRLVAKAHRLRPPGWEPQVRRWLRRAESALARA